MPTESQLFAATGAGLPDFYETLDRPGGDLQVHGHTELLNYRYVGGEVFVRSDDLVRAREVLEGDLGPAPAPGLGDGEAPVPPPVGGDGLAGGGIGIGGVGPLGGRPGRIRLPLRVPTAVPDAVDQLTNEGISASPHHVYVLGNHTQFGPAGVPENIPFPDWAEDYGRGSGTAQPPRCVGGDHRYRPSVPERHAIPDQSGG